MFGQMCQFDASREDWTQYSERLSHYFAANGITDAARKKFILLTVVGPATYKQLRSLVSSAKVDDKTYTQWVEALQAFHSPRPSEIVQRCKFNSRYRQPGESVSMFVSELRSLVELCSYGAVLDDMLRDRLVCGINNLSIQRRLLSEQDLTFEKAHTLALGMETAARNVQTVQKKTAGAAMSIAENSDSSETTVHKVLIQALPRTERRTCYYCGKAGHSPNECRFKDAYCHACGKKGRIAPVCKSAHSGKSLRCRYIKSLVERSLK